MREFILSRVCIVFLFSAAAVIAAPAQNALFTTLLSLPGPSWANGVYPYSSLIQATDGNFYGTTYGGGAYGDGTVFKISARGALTTLHSFNGSDGGDPFGGLVQGTDGNFYGITDLGGAYGLGTVFKITAGGTVTTLHSFDGTDGSGPLAALVQATDGNFYGTTPYGGSGNCDSGCGTVFKITPAGTLTTMYSFCAQTGCPDGMFPYAPLVQATDGNFYGTTSAGGASNNCYHGGVSSCGTVFKVTAAGTLTTLASFDDRDGGVPYAGLVQATDGNFYGTTTLPDGSVFKITPAGAMTTLYGFYGNNGAQPYAGLVQATDGNFYGTTAYGGTSGNCYAPPAGCGTVFKMTPSGTLTTLHSFDQIDGYAPYGGLVQGTDGNLYGTTRWGGPNYNGTIFRLLGPR
jgi:uncharacterized repeat protein (TIGR03803 family)